MFELITYCCYHDLNTLQPSQRTDFYGAFFIIISSYKTIKTSGHKTKEAGGARVTERLAEHKFFFFSA